MITLSTHVLDTALGRPAAGVALALTNGDGDILFIGATDADGRCPQLPTVAAGRFRLSFEIADYFRGLGADLPDPPFLDRVSIDFGVAEASGHYHVPILVSPYGYSTYRGS